MNSQQKQRITRMRNENIYLIAAEKTCDVPLKAKFKISGSTANLYTVTLELNNARYWIHCDCPDFSGYAHQYGVKCKHCCFVMMKVLKQDESVLNKNVKIEQISAMKDAYSKLTITQDLTNEKYRQKYLHHLNKSKSTTHTRELPEKPDKPEKEPDEDADCPICYDNLMTKDSDELSCCRVCKNYVHAACIKKWLTLGNNTCVYCRAKWSTNDTTDNDSDDSCEDSYGYLNLAR